RSPVAGPAAGSSGGASYPGAVTSFASDNYSPAHPDVLAALAAASAGHAISYGEDPWTARLQDAVRERFGADATAWPVLTGTGANVVALMAMLPRWGAVVASEHAHLNTDENGAPERVGGVKVLAVPAPDGKIGPDAVERFAGDLGDPHRAQPLVVSLTQSTELGTLYTPAEIREVADAAHAHGMRVHLDGSRLANAAAALDVPLRALTSDAGVDVLSFGGTKNGLALGEAVIVLDPSAGDGGEFVRKATMQLASKMRCVSAQLLALCEPVGDAVAEVDDAAPGDERWVRRATATRRTTTPRTPTSSGCATRGTPTRWPRGCAPGSPTPPASRSPSPRSSTRCSPRSRAPPSRACASATASTTGGRARRPSASRCAGCARGTRRPRTWTGSSRTCTAPSRSGPDRARMAA